MLFLLVVFVPVRSSVNDSKYSWVPSKSVQRNMTDSEGTQEYLESLTKDELRTLLIQLVVNK